MYYWRNLRVGKILFASSFRLSIIEDDERRASVGSDKLVAAKIHTLNDANREAVRRHMHALNARDRYLRFGFNASDEQIDVYVEQIDFKRDEVFGFLDEQHEIIGMVHLAYGDGETVGRNIMEFGVSVSESARNLSLGGQLFAYSAKRAAERGFKQMFIHTINKNMPMIKIIKRSGAEIYRDHGEIDAYLALPAVLNPWLKMRIEAQAALDLPDYGITVKLKGLQDAVSLNSESQDD